MPQSALYVGRFQPFHLGHLSVVKKILEENERVIILIGSAEKNFLPKDPFTAGERYEMIENSLRENQIPCEKFCIVPVRNINNYSLWVSHISNYVPPFNRVYTGSKIVEACFEGKYEKTHRPKEPGPEIVKLDRSIIPISATQVRDLIKKGDEKWKKMVPESVVTKIELWNSRERLQDVEGLPDVTEQNNRY